MVDQIRVKSGVLIGALVAGGLTAGTLTGAPPAHATCASFWGIGNGNGCTSTLFSAAIAIGTGATATALKPFGTAFSLGTNTSTFTGSLFEFATAVGDNSSALTRGLFGIATALGPNTSADTDTFGSGTTSLDSLGLNIAINVTPGATGSFRNTVLARGIGNVALNLFGANPAPSFVRVSAIGGFQVAANIGGPATNVSDASITAVNGTAALLLPNVAFNLLGAGNVVTAGPGPFAVAGSILQTNTTVKKIGPGFNINGIVVGGAAATRNANTSAPTAAATRNAKTSAPIAAAVRTGNKTAASAAAARTSTQKKAPAAAATSRGKK
jgi:hypothetical protein